MPELTVSPSREAFLTEQGWADFLAEIDELIAEHEIDEKRYQESRFVLHSSDRGTA